MRKMKTWWQQNQSIGPYLFPMSLSGTRDFEQTSMADALLV